jgi:hypothetical protein
MQKNAAAEEKILPQNSYIVGWNQIYILKNYYNN